MADPRDLGSGGAVESVEVTRHLALVTLLSTVVGIVRGPCAIGPAVTARAAPRLGTCATGAAVAAHLDTTERPR